MQPIRDWFGDPDDNTRDEWMWRLIAITTILIPFVGLLWGVGQDQPWMVGLAILWGAAWGIFWIWRLIRR